jgi:putative transposase
MSFSPPPVHRFCWRALVFLSQGCVSLGRWVNRKPHSKGLGKNAVKNRSIRASPVESGTKIGEVCRQLGVTEQTYIRWKRPYAGHGLPELRRLKQLEEENATLKRLVADLSLDRHMLQEVIATKR